MEEQVKISKRPSFLTVLGILSFIGIGLQALGALFTITTLSGIISLLCAAATLYGVLQMWKLKKTGFYIYAVFEIIPPIYTLATVGAVAFSFGAAGGGFMSVVATLSLFFPILFIVLYALNLKHMD
jgi:hypothetical protein